MSNCVKTNEKKHVYDDQPATCLYSATILGVTLLTASYVTLGGLLFSGVESRYLAHQAAVAAAAAESSSPVVMNSTMLLGERITFFNGAERSFTHISDTVSC